MPYSSNVFFKRSIPHCLNNTPDNSLDMKTLLALTLFVAVLFPRSLQSELVKRLPRINNNLGIQLMKEITKVNENTVISPYSALSSLGALYKGANGVTYDEMTSSMGLGSPGRDLVGATLHLAIKELSKILSVKNTSIDEEMVMRMYIQRGYDVSKNYKKALRYYYGMSVNELNFNTDMTGSIQKINGWISEKTNQYINTVIDESLKDETLLLTANAAYFQGEWMKEFSGLKTSRSEFKLDDKSMAEVDMMLEIFDLQYQESEELKFKSIRMNYKTDGLSMVILLPDEISGADRLIRELSGESVMELFSNLTNSKTASVKVTLPKFRLEQNYQLKEAISYLGMDSLFADNADLSLINKKNNLKVSNLYHKTLVENFERGSQETLISRLDITSSTFNQVAEKEFKVNRPFIFFITSKNPGISEIILFMGKVAYPSV